MLEGDAARAWLASRPLFGKRVLVTRAREQAEKTAATLLARGAEPVLLPTIELHEPRDGAAVLAAIDRLGTYAWVVFTSANGVARAWRALEARGLDARAFAGAKLAAIGPGTAGALAEHGLRADVIATEHRGEGLAADMLRAMKPGEPVLLLRAQVARDALPDALREAGHPVDVVAVYETRAPDAAAFAPVARALADGAIDAVTFTSASTVDHFVAMAGGPERAREVLARTRVASIGPITSEALGRHGLRVDVTAAVYTLDGLVSALEGAAQIDSH